MTAIIDFTTASSSSAAQRLRGSMAAARVSFTWLGVRKGLSAQQKAEAAEGFGAEGRYLSAAKKLLDTAHPAFKAVTAIRGRVISYWRGVSLPYPEPGIRLIRQNQIESFDRFLSSLRDELTEAVDVLEGNFMELKEAARDRLGRLFDEGDYPPALKGLFSLEWDFPSVEPPEYLLELKPELYEQEKARMTARFEAAVEMAESAFTSEFSALVSHLTERLNDGGEQKKVFRDSVITNLQEFFQRFRSLSVRSNEELEELVKKAQQMVKGVQPQELRDNTALRSQMATQMTGLQAALDDLMVDRPRRKILRLPGQKEGA